jgi:hypothetical protein
MTYRTQRENLAIYVVGPADLTGPQGIAGTLARSERHGLLLLGQAVFYGDQTPETTLSALRRDFRRARRAGWPGVYRTENEARASLDWADLTQDDDERTYPSAAVYRLTPEDMTVKGEEETTCASQPVSF